VLGSECVSGPGNNRPSCDVSNGALLKCELQCVSECVSECTVHLNLVVTPGAVPLAEQSMLQSMHAATSRLLPQVITVIHHHFEGFTRLS